MPGGRFTHQLTEGPYQGRECRIIKQNQTNPALYTVELRPTSKGQPYESITADGHQLAPTARRVAQGKRPRKTPTHKHPTKPHTHRPPKKKRPPKPRKAAPSTAQRRRGAK